LYPQPTRLPLQIPRQRIEIDIASGENDADPLFSDADLPFFNRSKGNRRRWLDNDFHRPPNRAHGRDDRVLAYSHNVVYVTPDDCKVWFADICPQSVSDGEFFFGVQHSSCTK